MNQQSNPRIEIVIRGGVGAGKTMMMDGIGSTLKGLGFNVVCKDDGLITTTPEGWYVPEVVAQDQIVVRTEEA